jgi:hypothetical protein
MNIVKSIVLTIIIIIVLITFAYSPINAEEKKSTDPNIISVTEIKSIATTILVSIATGFGGAAIAYFYNNKKSEQDSRRSYEYEARKRLYQECEPILFQFVELSDSALVRIRALAKNAKQGNLGPKRYNLSLEHYFIRSTVYRLLGPMVVYKLLQQKLTTIDLNLSPVINLQYQLSKILYYTFSSAKELAESKPQIPYDPDQIGEELDNQGQEEKVELRIKEPQKYWLQGLKVGKIENLVNTLIMNETNGNTFIKSFGEFETEFFEQESWRMLFEKEKGAPSDKNNHPFEIFFTLFSAEKGFHPKSRPVLWRILLTQAYIYQALKNIRKYNKTKFSNFEEFKKIASIDYSKFDWRQPGEQITDKEFRKPFEAVENYLESRLDDLF